MNLINLGLIYFDKDSLNQVMPKIFFLLNRENKDLISLWLKNVAGEVIWNLFKI
jgi:hypothetical protein